MQGDQYKQQVLIITIVCILLVVLATIAMIPITFALDNEEIEVIYTWLLIRDESKADVIQEINNFFLWMTTIKKKTEEKKDSLQQNPQVFEEMELANISVIQTKRPTYDEEGSMNLSYSSDKSFLSRHQIYEINRAE